MIDSVAEASRYLLAVQGGDFRHPNEAKLQAALTILKAGTVKDFMKLMKSARSVTRGRPRNTRPAAIGCGNKR